MDIIDLRVIITVLSFLAFAGIVIWAYSGRQKSRFKEASELPFADDEMQERTIERTLASHADSSAGTASNDTIAVGSASNRKDEVPHG